MIFSAALLLGLVNVASAAPATHPVQAPVELARADAQYSIKVGDIGPWQYPDDTPAQGFIDKSGKYYFQQSAALYEIQQSRAWRFYSGETIDDAKVSLTSAKCCA